MNFSEKKCKEEIRNGKNSSRKITMRVKGKIVLTIFLLTFLAAPFTEAADTSGSASVDLLSDYVWRGQTLSEDDGVVQPSVGITYGNFGANLWANFDAETEEHTETDLTLSYGFSKDKLSLEVGYIYYALEGTDDTQEAYLALAYDTILSPSLIIYYDFDEGDGAFLIASIGHSIGLMDVGVDSDGDTFTDFYNGEITASVSVPISKNLVIEPKIAYSFPLTNNAEDVFEALPSGENDIFYGGVGMSLGF
jgi:hypothetical protein